MGLPAAVGSEGDDGAPARAIAGCVAAVSKKTPLEQLADYVSLVGLVNIRPETDGGGAPRIRRLFRDPKAPQGLTPWDKALLYSLYDMSQSGKLQLTDMEVLMVGRIAP